MDELNYNDGKQTEDLDKFLTTARERFQLCVDAESELRTRSLEELNFFDGDQWPEDIKIQRKQDQRPCLVFNRIKTFVHQIVNDIRQSKPAPQVRPVDDLSDPKTAEVLQGIIRQINRISKADTVRSYAATYQVITGRGFYRILTRYESDDSFDQEIIISRIKNQASVYVDPAAKEPDYSDANWAFIAEDLLTADYKAEYPDSELAGVQDFSSVNDTAPGWATHEQIRVVEYFHVEYEPGVVALLADGSSMPLEKVPEGVNIIKTRKQKRRVIKWCKFNAVEKLEEKIWPGKWIPIIPVLGEELDINGKTRLAGLVRDAMSPQRQYNFMRTMQTETVALAPRAPYIIAEGQIEGYEEQWEKANTRNYAALVYRPQTLKDNLVPPPQRNAIEAPIQAITMAVREAAEDLKSVTGIYDASLGNKSNETSGVALRQRRMEGDTANYHFVDNLNTAITHEARILVDLIPKIYDRPGRIVRMLGDDDSEKRAMIGSQDEAQQAIPAGIQGIFDLSVGRYDVSAEIGPSISTKRQEAAESLLELAKADPGLMMTAPDLVYKNLDIPGAQEIAERRKRALPPGIADDDENQQQVPPAAQQKLAQLGQLVEQLTAELEQVSDEVRTNKAALDSKERIEYARLEVQREQIAADVAMCEAKLGSAEGLQALKLELETMREQYAQLYAAASADDDREHQANEAERARQAQAEQQAAAAAQQQQPGAQV